MWKIATLLPIIAYANPLGLRIWVGIDVCQKSLDVYIRPSEKFFQVTNDEIGIAKLVQTLNNIQPELIVLEATGGMEIDVVIKLTEAGLAVAIINPRLARDFAKATRQLAKTDAIDAKVLAHFADGIRPEVRPISDESSRQLEDLVALTACMHMRSGIL